MSRSYNLKRKFISLIVTTVFAAVIATFYFNYKVWFNIKTGEKETVEVDNSASIMTSPDLSVHFIDVGQGSSAFIELPDGTTMLIDAGIKSQGTTVCNYISGLGYTQIDYLVLTHGDNDHVGGMGKVLDTFEVKNIYRPFQVSVSEEDDGSGGKIVTVNPNDDIKGVYESALDKSKVNVISNDAYYEFITKTYSEIYHDELNNVRQALVTCSYDGLKIEPKAGYTFSLEFFAPLKSIPERTIASFGATNTTGYATVYYGTNSSQIANSVSPFILLEHQGRSYLFTGDAIDKQETALLNSLTEAERVRFDTVDVYHVAHHGSSDSSCSNFLELIKPKMSVINVGANNRYHHPRADTLERLQVYSGDNIYRTDEDGNITFYANSEDLQVKTNNIAGSVSNKTVAVTQITQKWYVYVAGVTAAVFVSGLIYIFKDRINYEKRKASYSGSKSSSKSSKTKSGSKNKKKSQGFRW